MQLEGWHQTVSSISVFGKPKAQDSRMHQTEEGELKALRFKFPRFFVFNRSF